MLSDLFFSFLGWIIWLGRQGLSSSENDERLTLGLCKLIDLILLPEVDLVNWLFNLSLECVLE